MATRLLSFLNDIEHAVLTARGTSGPAWDCQRMVNFKDGLARMTLKSAAADGQAPASGAILIQSLLLADGSTCVKATLSWERSPVGTTIAVHTNPEINWASEAGQIATTWLAGPPTTAAVETVTPAAVVPPTPAADKAASG